jgi:hypothetical protein
MSQIKALRNLLLVTSLLALPALSACGDDGGEEQYDNLEECVVDHTVEEGLTEQQAITTCLLDHLDQLNLDFADVAECVDYVTNNGGYADSRDAACQAYIDEINAG